MFIFLTHKDDTVCENIRRKSRRMTCEASPLFPYAPLELSQLSELLLHRLDGALNLKYLSCFRIGLVKVSKHCSTSTSSEGRSEVGSWAASTMDLTVLSAMGRGLEDMSTMGREGGEEEEEEEL